MQEGLKGRTLFEVQRIVDLLKLEEFACALDSTTSAETATLVPFFGPTVGGEESFVEALGVDPSRVLLGGMAYTWTRPFEPGEAVTVKLSVEDVYEKSGMQFMVVLCQFVDTSGQTVQTQKATFIERGAA